MADATEVLGDATDDRRSRSGAGTTFPAGVQHWHSKAQMGTSWVAMRAKSCRRAASRETGTRSRSCSSVTMAGGIESLGGKRGASFMPPANAANTWR